MQNKEEKDSYVVKLGAVKGGGGGSALMGPVWGTWVRVGRKPV